MKMFVGLDVAREVHRACAIDGNAAPVLSHAVASDPGQITVLGDGISALEAGEVTVALDLPGGTATLPCAMIAEAGCRLVHTPGLSVNRARRGMRGGGNKSDPRDAATIAELARTRPGLRHVDTGREIDVDIRLLVGRRSEIVRDQTRRPGRLRDLLSSLFPALERRIAVKTRTGLTFPSLHAAPHELRSTRPAGIARKITRSAAHLRGVPQMVGDAIALARAQSMDVPGAQTRARLVRELAAEALAAAAGLTTVLRRSGKYYAVRRANSGDKALKRVFFQSAFAALPHPESKTFHDRKRAEGKRHNQAVIALARRRINVIRAILNPRQPYVENVKGAA